MATCKVMAFRLLRFRRGAGFLLEDTPWGRRFGPFILKKGPWQRRVRGYIVVFRRNSIRVLGLRRPDFSRVGASVVDLLLNAQESGYRPWLAAQLDRLADRRPLSATGMRGAREHHIVDVEC